MLNQAGKISLSGGSYQLNGIVKKANKDAKQWKLIVDGNEIKNEDISWKLVSATTAKLPDSIKINDGIVSWTDQIEAGTYSFYVLANYKETKIQTSLITLTISSEHSEILGNLNYAIKDALYDENTIDQKLLDFVKNVYFSLDYTENDYDAEMEGHKQGVIKINNFNIGYKNSKNIFKASNSINDDISSTINNDSGITMRTSSNLFKIVSENYNSVKSLIDDGINLADECISVRDDFEDLNTSLLIISGICTVLSIALISILVLIRYNTRKNAKLYSWIIFMIVPVLSAIMSITILVCYLKDHYGDMGKLKSNFDNIKSDTGYALISNCKNDSKYFKNKETFNCLNVKLKKYLKHYYESGFSEDHYDIHGQKVDGTSDFAIFAGGINKIMDMKTTCETLIHRWFYIIIPLFVLLVIEFTFLSICFIADRQSISLSKELMNLKGFAEIQQKQAEIQNFFLNNWKVKYFLGKLYKFWDILGGLKRGRL